MAAWILIGWDSLMRASSWATFLLVLIFRLIAHLPSGTFHRATSTRHLPVATFNRTPSTSDVSDRLQAVAMRRQQTARVQANRKSPSVIQWRYLLEFQFRTANALNNAISHFQVERRLQSIHVELENFKETALGSRVLDLNDERQRSTEISKMALFDVSKELVDLISLQESSMKMPQDGERSWSKMVQF